MSRFVARHRSNDRRSLRYIAGSVATLLVAGLVTVSAAQTAVAATGTISGTVFEDFDFDGIKDAGSSTTTAVSATDVGVQNVSVKVTDNTGTVVSTLTTNAAGVYSGSVTANTTAVRLEFTLPAGYLPGPNGTDSKGTVQFINLGQSGNLGIVREGNYAPANARIVLAQQVAAMTNSAMTNLAARQSIMSTTWANRSTPANLTTEATAAQTGSVWGLAQLDGDYIFSAALFKRHSKLGPGGLGAIYLTTAGGAADATPWVTIPNVGTNPRSYEASTVFNDWFHDASALASVNKIGLGALTLAPDGKSLYVVNLANKSLYQIPFTRGAGGIPVAGTPALVADLSTVGSGTACLTANVRPFGVSTQNGSLWITKTCVGPATGNLRGYVYQANPVTNVVSTAPSVEVPLNYGRGNAYNYPPFSTGTGNPLSAVFRPWVDTFSGFSQDTNSGTWLGAYSMPLLSDVAFDTNNDMTIGIKDRFGDMGGYQSGNANNADGARHDANGAGDVLRACRNAGNTAWTLESNAGCVTRTGQGAGNGDGPGGGEFYRDNGIGGIGDVHDQTALGALLQVPGYGQVVNTAYDPGDFPRVQGYRFSNNSNGDYVQNTSATGGFKEAVGSAGSGAGGNDVGSFSKAGGLGDLQALIDPEPVEIGNRLWFDSNRNGLQDVGEANVVGVTVNLYDATGTTSIGSTITDANGNYFFNAANTANVIAAETTYIIRANNPANYAAGAVLGAYSLTTPTAGANTEIDSNATLVSGFPELTATTPVAGANHSFDIGFVPGSVSVGDFVWRDTNRNGIQDPGEPGIQGVSLTITGPAGAVTDINGAAVGPVTTDASGAYLFPNLPVLTAAQQYTVTINPASPALAGLIPTITGAGTTATDSSTGSAASGVLATSGASDLTLDFGFVSPSVSVGDFVWLDADRDGIQDGGESGIPGVVLTLTGPAGAVTGTDGLPVGPATTTATGAYLFSNLPVLTAGQQYTVTINAAASAAALTGLSPTLAAQGGNTALDSSTGTANSATLTTNGSSDLTLDFGFIRSSVSVGDRVWRDINPDGTQEDGEPGIGNVVLTIAGPGGAAVTDINGNPVGSVTTNGSGAYLFPNLPALPAGSHYTVAIDTVASGAALAGLVPTIPGVGSPVLDSSTGSAESGDLTTNGASDLTLDFGFIEAPSVSVGDFVWVDTDRDGVQDPGEPGIAGVTLTITGPTGNPVTSVNGQAVGPVVTNAAGAYLFSNLPVLAAGQSYTVTIDGSSPSLAPYIPTIANGTPGVGNDSSTGSATSVSLTTDGSSDPTLDFGFVRPRVSVGDYVWLDTDRDGVQDAAETGIQGVTLTITGPGGVAVTDVFGVPVGPATTDANGLYTFANLPVLAVGGYTVTINGSSPALAAYVPTLAGAGGDPALDSSTGSATSGSLPVDGNADLSLDFGFVIPAAVAVGDFVFSDTDHDGIQDLGEPGIEGVVLAITGPGGVPALDPLGNTVGPVTTDAAGAYLFGNLAPLPAGSVYTVTIVATDPSTIAALAGFVPTLPNQGGNPALDSSTGSADSTELTTNGQTDRTLDFGFFQPAVSVGDFVWRDLDRDGIQDSGEDGIAGVVLNLTDEAGNPVLDINGDPVPAATTDALGAYLFDQLPVLPAGEHYVVTIDTAAPSTIAALAGLIPTLVGVGADPAVDSATGSAESGDLVADLDSDLTLDFGFVTPPAVSVGDFVWRDLDWDGIQEGGEPGIPGVVLEITDPNGDPVTDINGLPVGAVTTDANGAYLFNNLPALQPGESYTVTIDLTDPSTIAALAGLVPTLSGVGDPALDSATGSDVTGDLIADGDADLTLDFGFVQAAVSVGDFVWLDTDRDGVQDFVGGVSIEPGIDGVSLSITGPAGAVIDVFGNPVGPVTTTGGGGYVFPNLPALLPGQSYTVTLDPTSPALTGLVPTQTGTPDPARDSSTGSAVSGPLTVDGASDPTLDFGFTVPAVSVGDFVWVDSNRDGIQNPGEPGLQGVSLTISGPGGPVTDVLGVAVGPVVTDATGAYLFPNLPALPAGDHYVVTVDPTSPSLAGYIPTLPGVGAPGTDSSTGSAESGDLIGNGSSDLTLDFGFVRPAVSVGNYVWVDADRDGIQTSGEVGIEGVVLTLTGPGGPVTDVLGNPVGPATTDANGLYLFTGLPVLTGTQVYIVTIDQAASAAALAPYTATLPGQGADPAIDSSTNVAVSRTLPVNGDADLTLDFGFIRPAVSVGDYVWRDLDRDGVQEPGEPGIAGVELTLTGPTGPVTNVLGELVGPTTTDADGIYSFTNLPALGAGESYVVTLNAGSAANQLSLLGLVPTTTGVGTPATDSSTETASSITLFLNGAVDNTLDFGFVPARVSVGDYVWLDSDRDGIQEIGEPGIPGVVMVLTGPGGGSVTDTNGDVVTSVPTDANGAYLFDELPVLAAGENYTVSIDFTAPSTIAALVGLIPTLAGAGGNAELDSSTDSATSTELVLDGAADLSLDFGFSPAVVTVGDFVWLDSDRDGLQDAGEPGIPGVVLTLTGPGGTSVTDINGLPVGPATTTSTGAYQFTNLPALAAGESYTVTIDVAAPSTVAALAGLIPTLEGVGGDEGIDSSTNTAVSGDLSLDGAIDLSLDFGFVPARVSVGDYVWLDADRDGIQDGGEAGIEGVVLVLTGPDGDPVTDVNGAAVGPVTTDALGAYLFSDLPVLAAGESYTVTIDVTDPSTIAALAGLIPTLPGVGADRSIDSSTGFADSTDLIVDGAADLTLDFGFVPARVSVGDYVWLDTDRDGLQEPGELGIQGVVLNLTGPGGVSVTDVNGAAVGPATTNAAGAYLFSNLPVLAAGESYTVTIDLVASATALAGLIPTLLEVGADRAIDSSTVFAVSADLTVDGAVDPTLDFGFVPARVSVGDYVWLDADRDGLQDGAESGIEGVVLVLTGPDGQPVTDVNGAAVGPVTTNAAGAYLFSNLPVLAAGESYTVTIDQVASATALAGLIPTLPGVGGDRAVDSSTGFAVSTDLIVDGAADLTLDFGFVRPVVSVGNFVWLDTDRDGLQDAGEPGISGVVLVLTGPDGDPVTDVNGAAVAPVTTDGVGAYLFSNLPALAAGESYTVTIDLVASATALAGLIPTLAEVGADRGVDSSTGFADSTDLVIDGAADLTLDFGFVPARVSVGDYVWLDADRDGLQEPGEVGIEGVVLTLTGPDGDPVTDINGVPVGPVTTDEVGAYLFSDLPVLAAGESYTVTIDVTDPSTIAALAGLVPTLAAVGADRGVDSSTGFADSTDLVVDGAADLTLDFGFVPARVSVGDYVWLDADRDGIQDGAESGIEGVVLNLTGPDGEPVTDVNGAAVGPVTTNAAGAYLFSNLPVLAAGESYTVTIDVTDPSTIAALAGLIPTLPGVGADRGADSSTGFADSTDLITDGAADLTLDFGFVPARVSVGDYVWLDADRDGLQELGEVGIEGVVLVLTGPGGVSVTDVNGAAVGPVTTDGLGAYLFSNLPVLAAGESYTVTIDVTDPSTIAALTGLQATLPQVGADRAVDSSTGSEVSASLTVDGASDLTLDFGFIRAAVSVGDYVWLDVDRDGIQDGAEFGIQGVVLVLTGPDGEGVTDIDGNPVGPQTTTAAGAYLFANLPVLAAGQSYTVTIDVLDPSTVAALTGLVPTLAGVGDPATDSATGSDASGDLIVDGAADLTLDFGFVRSAVSVGDFVWLDTDRDGVQDGGEPGIPGVTLTITGPGGADVTDVFGNPVGPVVTAPNGEYVFPDLPALPAGQSYTVTVDSSSPALVDYVPTQTGQGTTGTDSSTGSASTTDLAGNGDSDTSLDFGFIIPPAVSVGDFIWADLDHNGVQDPAEPGIPGVVLDLTGPDGEPVLDTDGNPVGSATTDENGLYLFGNLPPLQAGDHYTVTVNLTDPSTIAALADRVPTVTGAGTPGTDSSTGSAESTDLTTDGAVDTSLDFGFFRPSVSVGDYVWIDTNRDGLQDENEPGIPGVVLSLVGPDGNPVTGVDDVVVGTTVTDGDGFYEFGGLPVLPAGQHYTVRIEQLAPQTVAALGFLIPTVAGAGDDTSVDSSTNTAESVDLTEDLANDPTLDFGYVLPAYAVGDTVWFDTNNNGAQDGGETGTPGVTVTLVNSDGTPAVDVFGDPIPSVVTDSEGHYVFDNVPPGEYQVIFTDIPAGYGFGIGIPSNGETPVFPVGPGAPNQIPSVPTDGVDAPVINPTLDAPLVPLLAVGDYVWLDINRNGVQDAGELPVPNVTVQLQTGAGVTVATTVTDAAGHYVFDGLLPGSYQVVFSGIPAGFVFTAVGGGAGDVDSNPNSAGVTTAFELVPGSPDVRPVVAGDGVTQALLINSTIDAGIIPVVYAIGDYVFLDNNLNGIQDAGEPAVPGVTVDLLNPDGSPATHSDGSPVLPVVTDANGHYVFDNLLPGQYEVVFSNIPSGYEPTVPQAPGSTPDNDSDGSGMGRTPVVPIGPGQPGTRPVQPGDGELIAGQINPTIDLGIANSAAVEAARNALNPTTPVVPVVPTEPGKGLPNTGFDLASNLGVGFGLLLMGAWLVLLGRRSRWSTR